MTAQLRTLDLADHRVAFTERPVGASERPPLVLLHGGAVNHRMWARQLDAFPGRRLIAPDARGHGGSSDATDPHRLCDDVVALLDALDVRRAVLIGLSMGGGTAVDTALEHPERVAGLVVSGAGTSEPDFTDPWTLDVLGAWQRAQGAQDLEAWIAAFMRFVAGPHRELTDVAPHVVDAIEGMVRDTLTTHLTVDAEGRPIPPHPPTPVADTWERLRDIDVPVLGVAGTDDSDDHRRMCRALTQAVKDGRYAEVPGAAHYPNVEHPDTFDAEVAAFLATHDL